MTMKRRSWLEAMLAAIALCGVLPAAHAADAPAPQQHDWVARNFRFHTGEVLPEVRIHYVTIGAPTGEPVLVLHGTAQSSAAMLSPAFAGELFGPGQPLDAARYYLIIPDGLGTGRSSKPSDGLGPRFPHYDYDDMVEAQWRLVNEGLQLRHLRLVIGNSMGGMHTWLWGTRHPGFADALVPMACQPSAMSGRNWILRRMLVESIRRDPAYRDGQYTTQPPSLRTANVFFGFATSGGTQALYAAAPARAQADRLVDERLAAPPPADANDYVYQWDASGDYDPAPMLDRIDAAVLAINSADDERNPPEFGIMERELPRVRGAKLFLIPTGPDTRGHATTGNARLWKDRVAELLASAPHRAP
jgi:homoserine O-acetyltransferase